MESIIIPYEKERKRPSYDASGKGDDNFCGDGSGNEICGYSHSDDLGNVDGSGRICSESLEGIGFGLGYGLDISDDFTGDNGGFGCGFAHLDGHGPGWETADDLDKLREAILKKKEAEFLKLIGKIK